ncbi:hypothetical protein HanIR_Chr03g0148141 [Helianthus annuus]|nr:hypothetical protein HanIR_Chr03g0148141 [Helianthus annuus]
MFTFCHVKSTSIKYIGMLILPLKMDWSSTIFIRRAPTKESLTPFVISFHSECIDLPMKMLQLSRFSVVIFRWEKMLFENSKYYK